MNGEIHGLLSAMLKKLTSWVPIAPMFFVAGILSPVMALGDGISMSGRLAYSGSSIETEDKITGEETETDATRISQLYTLNLNKQIYPYLVFRAGGIFELTNSERTSDRTEGEFEETVLRPFAELAWATPLAQASFTYHKTEIESTTLLFPTRSQFVDNYTVRGGWQPEGLPSLQMSYVLQSAYDDPETTESHFEHFDLSSSYKYKDLALQYGYSSIESEDLIEDNGSLRQDHSFNARYSTDLTDRLSISSRMALSFAELEPFGGNVFDKITGLGAESYLLDDSTPAANIAGEFTPVDAATPLTAVNIGMNGGLTPVSVSLGFSGPTEVDAVYVMLLDDDTNPLLASPGEINDVAGAFVWRAFTSDDELTWTEHVVTREDYDPFLNRFEIGFSPGGEAEYVKVVTTPLGAAAPAEIRIESLQSYYTSTGRPGQITEDTNQSYRIGLEWRISDETTASYDFGLGLQENQPSGTERTNITNSLTLQHRFNSILFANAQLRRKDSDHTISGATARTSYGVSLRADYLDTFRQTLSYQGSSTEEAEGSSSAHSITLRSSADLYEDISLDLDIGYVSNLSVEDVGLTNTFLRIGSNIDPHPRLHFSVDYALALSAGDSVDSVITQRAGLQIFWTPLRTFSVSARLNYRDTGSDTEEPLLFQDYSVNWSPFPDGAIDFSVSYTDTADSRDNATRSISPKMRWQIMSGADLELSYAITTRESETRIEDITSMRAILRIRY